MTDDASVCLASVRQRLSSAKWCMSVILGFELDIHQLVQESGSIFSSHMGRYRPEFTVAPRHVKSSAE